MEVQPISIQIQILENLFKIGDEFVQGRPQNCCGSKLVVYDDDNIRVEFPGLQTGGTLVACPPGRPRYCPHNELINHSAQCAPATDTICTMLVLAWDLILKRLLSWDPKYLLLSLLKYCSTFGFLLMFVLVCKSSLLFMTNRSS
ncbi:hypothetical protein ACOSQ4_023674 [Xanthoceras sorbifolium]